MVRPADEDSRGLVDPAAGLQRFRLDRIEPTGHVARFVDRYWIVSWDLPAGESHTQELLAHPVVNLSVEAHQATLTGVSRRRSARTIVGSGRVLGVMFRPGGFRPLAPGPMHRLTDRQAHLVDWFGPSAERWARAVRAAPDAEAMVAEAHGFLASRLPTGHHPCEEAVAIAEQIAADRSIVRINDLTALTGLSERTLQRLFAEHVGVSPKWVMRRYRLYEAAERIAHDDVESWADLAADLGYADQAHLTRELTAAFGAPPDRYSRRQLR